VCILDFVQNKLALSVKSVPLRSNIRQWLNEFIGSTLTICKRRCVRLFSIYVLHVPLYSVHGKVCRSTAV